MLELIPYPKIFTSSLVRKKWLFSLLSENYIERSGNFSYEDPVSTERRCCLVGSPHVRCWYLHPLWVERLLGAPPTIAPFLLNASRFPGTGCSVVAASPNPVITAPSSEWCFPLALALLGQKCFSLNSDLFCGSQQILAPSPVHSSNLLSGITQCCLLSTMLGPNEGVGKNLTP